MHFQILGTLRVLDNGNEVDIGPRKQRALLAVLLLSPNRVVTTDRLLESLWSDDSLGKENALWVYISRLRGLLEPDREARDGDSILETHDHGYLLRLDDHELDSARFAELTTQGVRLVNNDPGTAVDLLTDALGLWRGELLEDFLHDEFTQIERRYLTDTRLDAFEALTDTQLATGRAGEIVTDLEAAVGEHPNRERIVHQLMLALYRSGRTVDALRAFERHRRMLSEDLGLDPSPEIRRLEEQILLHDPRLQRRPHGAVAATPGHGGTNPFKGLRSFGEDDGDVFFGRDQAVSDLVRRLDGADRLLTLVGSSGSGKSSIVRAGLIPAIRKGAIEGSDGWLLAQMVPGAHPFAELEAALLRSTLDAPSSLRDQLDDGEMGLMRAALRVLPSDSSRLLLVIDQFEELFTMVESEHVRRRFLQCFNAALDDPRGRIRIVLTLRADFYDRPLAHGDFATRMARGVVNVVPLTPNQLEAAANEPARQAGVNLQPALLATLITDVIGQPGGLPLFQYALTDLFDRRDGDELTLAGYEEMGGVRGALSTRADDLFDRLDDTQRLVARQLFLRLVSIADSDESVRRRVPARELLDLGHDSVATQSVVETFGEHRLLSFDLDAVSGDPTLEVAHEALLTEWNRLREWIDEARGDLRRHAALTASINEWREANEHPDYLLSGTRLDNYLDWSATSTLSLTFTEIDFIRQSTAVRDDHNREESNRQALQQAESKKAGRRAWILTAALGLVLVGIVGFVVFTREDPKTKVGFISIGFDNGGDIANQLDNGINAAMRDLDIEGNHLIPISDFDSEVADLLLTDPELIVIAYLEFDSPTPGAELALRNPDTTFALVADNLFDVPPNASIARYAAHEASFIVGAAAALTSTTGTVGFIGGLPIVIDPFQAGFVAGAKHADPDVEVLTHTLVAPLSTAFRTPILGERAAEEIFGLGADVIYVAAGHTGKGVHDAAARLSDELDVQLWSIGVDVDEWLTATAAVRDHILTSALKRHDSAIVEMVSAFVDGRLESGGFDLDLSNDGVGFATSGNHLSATTLEKLESIRQGIIAGDIDVPDEMFETPSVHPDPDVVIRVVYDGQTCAVDTAAVRHADVVRVNITNSTDEFFVFSLDQNLGGFVDQLTTAGVPGQSERSVFAFVGANVAVSAVCYGDSGPDRRSLITLTTAAEVVVSVVFDGESCGVDRQIEIITNQSIRFDFWNNSEERAGLGGGLVVDDVTVAVLQETPQSEWAFVGPPVFVNFLLEAGETRTLDARPREVGRWAYGCYTESRSIYGGVLDVVAG